MSYKAKIRCPYCNKIAHEKSRMSIGKEILLTLDCSHTIVRDALTVESYEEMVSSDGRTPFGFQVKTAEFGEAADCNFICAHEMGVGKTIIECLLLKRNFKKLTPCLIVVKSGLRLQWFAEILRWTGEIAEIIQGSNDKPDFDLHDIFIISFDTLRLVRPVLTHSEIAQNEELEKIQVDEFDMSQRRGKRIKKVKWGDDICGQFKHIVIDETQMIKNPASSRTRSLQDIYKSSMKANNRPPRVVGLSGTPIKNRPSEYETMLQLIRPEVFWPGRLGHMIKHDPYTGKEVGLRDPDEFKEITKDWIIRYKREDVLPDLPKIFRQFRLAEMEGGFMEAYKRTIKEFQKWMDVQEKSPNMTDLLGWFSRMRHITGMAKINPAIEFVEEFLLSNNRKLVIFLHHKQTAEAMEIKLSKFMREGAFEEPLRLHAGLDDNARFNVVEEFKKAENRVMIASQLASGEGLNLQFCSDALMMERQWNPTNEEQCEARFPRPGSTADKVNVWYLVAAGTLDEFLTELVERKRAMFQQVMDGKETSWDNSNLMQELADVLHKKGLKKFEI